VSSSRIQLRIPKELKDAATRQAEVSGVSLNLFIATALAARVGAYAEVQRAFAARGLRTTPARAKALLSRLGSDEPLRDDDRLDASDEAA
jgi:uncharacterized protein (DUF1778 family)